MATHKSEKYGRLMYLLSFGCTKVTRSYIMKQVRGTSPSGHNPSPWTLDDFLKHNKTIIDKTHVGPRKETQKLLFPPSGGADIERWDLLLLCFVFLELCNPSFLVKMDYDNFKTMRNRLCHTATGMLSDSEYNVCMGQLTAGIRRCLTDIQDPVLTAEMEETIRAVETDAALQMERFMEKLKDWHTDETAVLARVEQGVGRVEQNLNQLTEVQQVVMKSLTALTKAQNIQIDIPETKLKLTVKNCESNNETFICKKIIEYLKPKIQHLDVDKQDEMQEAVTKAMTELLGNDIELIKGEQKCIILHLKVQSIDSLISLWQRCIAGEMTTIFKPVEKAVQNLQGFESAKIEVLLTEEEFWCCMERIVTSLRNVSSCTQHRPRSTPVSDIKGLSAIVTESQPPDKGTYIEMTIRPSSFDQLSHIIEVCKSGKLNENLKELSSVFKSTYGISHLDIEAELLSDETILNNEAGFEEHVTKRPKHDFELQMVVADGYQQLQDETADVMNYDTVGNTNNPAQDFLQTKTQDVTMGNHSGNHTDKGSYERQKSESCKDNDQVEGKFKPGLGFTTSISQHRKQCLNPQSSMLNPANNPALSQRTECHTTFNATPNSSLKEPMDCDTHDTHPLGARKGRLSMNLFGSRTYLPSSKNPKRKLRPYSSHSLLSHDTDLEEDIIIPRLLALSRKRKPDEVTKIIIPHDYATNTEAVDFFGAKIATYRPYDKKTAQNFNQHFFVHVDQDGPADKMKIENWDELLIVGDTFVPVLSHTDVLNVFHRVKVDGVTRFVMVIRRVAQQCRIRLWYEMSAVLAPDKHAQEKGEPEIQKLEFNRLVNNSYEIKHLFRFKITLTPNYLDIKASGITVGPLVDDEQQDITKNIWQRAIVCEDRYEQLILLCSLCAHDQRVFLGLDKRLNVVPSESEKRFEYNRIGNQFTFKDRDQQTYLAFDNGENKLTTKSKEYTFEGFELPHHNMVHRETHLTKPQILKCPTPSYHPQSFVL